MLKTSIKSGAYITFLHWGGKPYDGKLTLILGTTDTDPHVLHMYNR